MANLVYCLHHGPVDRVTRDIAHERAIDLQVIDRKVLEVGKGRHPAAEIVERETAAQRLQLTDQMRRLGKVCDRRCLRDLEADRAVWDPTHFKPAANESQEIVLAQGCARKVDCPSMFGYSTLASSYLRKHSEG